MHAARPTLAFAFALALPCCSATSEPPAATGGGDPPDAGASSSGEVDAGPIDVKPEAGVCAPFENLGCKDGRGTICAADGSRTVEFECDPVQGMVCDPDGCHGECAPGTLAQSYIGCEYWPTVTSNAVLSEPFHFAVAIANSSMDAANVVVTRGDEKVATRVVDAQSLVVLELPWVAELKGPDVINGSFARTENVLVADGAYRLRSDRPLAAYQFNALEYQAGPTDVPGCTTGCYSFSNDASLLLPTTALGTRYAVMGYHAYHVPEVPNGVGVDMGDFVAITATADATQVDIEASAAIVGGGGVGPLQAGEKASVSLSAGDVLEIFSAGKSNDASLSGTRISSSTDKPLQVVSGVPCTLVPETVTACDHIEESVLPLATLGSDHIVTVPTTPAGVRIHTVWIQTVEPQTTLHFDPPDVHPEVTLGVPQRLRIGPIDRDFRVWSSRPFGVTQYMHGQGSGLGEPYSAGAGDPSQGVVVPSEQFRTQYIFLSPDDYDDAYVNVVAKTGSAVVLDGETLDTAAFEPVGESGLAVLRQHLGKGEVHTMSSSAAFGIVVYGYGMYTSYMYPGGLDLKTIQVPR